MFDSYRWIKAFKRSRAINRVHEAKLPDEGFSDPDQMRKDEKTEVLEGAIDNLLKSMVSNKIQRHTVTIKDPSKLKRFMKDVKPFVKKKLLLVKQNPIDSTEMFISLGSKSQMREDDDIFSADDTQSWPSGPFGKKDDYADESGDSYKRAKDWSIDKPGEDEDTKGTGYKEDQT